MMRKTDEATRRMSAYASVIAAVTSSACWSRIFLFTAFMNAAVRSAGRLITRSPVLIPETRRPR